MPQPQPPSEDALHAGMLLKPVKTSPVPLQASQTRRPSMVKRLVRQVGLVTLLTGAGAVVGLALWTSAVLILRPHPPNWLAQYLPQWSTDWGNEPVQTYTEILAELEAQQQFAGEIVDVAVGGEAAALRNFRLLPVFETRSPCNSDCDAIAEIRLYGLHHREQQTEHLQLLHRLTVKGPTETDVLKTFAQADAKPAGSTFRLPLESVKSLTAKGLPGGWFTLTGRWRAQGTPVLYGQLLYVNPQTRQIHSLLNWQSPSGRLPDWHNIDGVGLPELLVRQSHGLEPSFGLYQVSSIQSVHAPTRLQEIPLTPIGLPAALKTSHYQNALYLAQNGLWTDAEKQLTALKTQAADEWPEHAEQQLQLVGLHARFSANQANREWSQPSQKLLALLLDGQWQPALIAVKSAESRYERAVLPLLERDSNRIWRRVTASLKVNPNQPEARIWGGLLLLAKEDEKAALQWLTKDKESPLKKEFEAIAQRVNRPPAPPIAIARPTPPSHSPSATPVTTASPQPNATAAIALASLMGTAVGMDTIDDAAWQRSSATDALTLQPGQQWFAITPSFGYSGDRWQRQFGEPNTTDADAIARFLRTLGLGRDATLDLIDPVSGQFMQTVQVQGVRWQRGKLALLTSGQAMPGVPTGIAVTPGQWRNPADVTPQPLTLLLQTQPATGDRLLQILQAHLGLDPTTLKTTLQQSTQSTDKAAVRWVDVVAGGDPELLVTLAPELTTALGATTTNGVRLMMTTQGELIFSSAWANSTTFAGWVYPPGSNAALVTSAGNATNLLTWSSQNRRFQ